VSSSRGGIRSSVNGTRGSMEIMDRVKKSSGVTIGTVRLENDLAADLRAFKDAVRLDLKADLRLGNSRLWMLDLFPPISCCSKTLKSNESTSMSDPDNGSSNILSPGGDETGCILRVGKDFLPRDPGVETDT
jgi:hypothetical protein